MKMSLKKLPALLGLSGLLLLTGCTAKTDMPEYEARADQYVAMLVSTDEAELEETLNELEENYDDFEQQISLYPYTSGDGEKFEFTADAYVSLLKAYTSNYDEFGAYIGVKEYEGGSYDEEDQETSFSAVYEFEDHDMRISLVFDKYDVVTTVSIDPIYSTGEIAEKAALNTLLGMGSVFVVLIILCLLISSFRYIHVIEEKLAGKAKEKEAAAAPAAKSAPAAAPAPKKAAPAAAAVAAPGLDPGVVAAITAAIAQDLGTSADGFVVRSIRRRSGNKWK